LAQVPIGSASIGQVHKATLRLRGLEVVIKVRAYRACALYRLTIQKPWENYGKNGEILGETMGNYGKLWETMGNQKRMEFTKENGET